MTLFDKASFFGHKLFRQDDTRYLVIAPGGFVPDSWDAGFSIDHNTVNNNSGSAMNIYAPVSLPHEATLLWAKVIGSTSTPTWKVYRNELNGSSSLTICTNTMNSLGDPDTTYADIDLLNYYYQLEIAALAHTKKIYRAIIAYTR